VHSFNADVGTGAKVNSHSPLSGTAKVRLTITYDRATDYGNVVQILSRYYCVRVRRNWYCLQNRALIQGERKIVDHDNRTCGIYYVNPLGNPRCTTTVGQRFYTSVERGCIVCLTVAASAKIPNVDNWSRRCRDE
jgi:hypothetical protein